MGSDCSFAKCLALEVKVAGLLDMTLEMEVPCDGMVKVLIGTIKSAMH